MLLRFFSTVGAIVLLLSSLTGCQGVRKEESGLDTTPITPKLVDHTTLRTLERELYGAVNQYRRSRQLPPLTLAPAVSQQARLYSKRLATKTVAIGESQLEEKIKTLPFSLKVEKAAQTIAISGGDSNPVVSTVQRWITNSKQRQYLEGDYNSTGIGIAQGLSGEYYITQVFIKESSHPLTQTVPWDTSLDQWNTSLEPWKQNNTLAKSPKSNRPTDANLIKMEQEIHRQVNQYRLSKQLPPMRMDARISTIARVYSHKMASKQATFSHDGFEQRVQAMGSTVPLRSAAENLAYLKGYPDLATTAVQGWIDSPGHQKNMVGEFDVTGIGIAKNAAGEYYFTQLFLLQK